MADDLQVELEEVVSHSIEFIEFEGDMLSVGIISVRLSRKNSCTIQILLLMLTS